MDMLYNKIIISRKKFKYMEVRFKSYKKMRIMSGSSNLACVAKIYIKSGRFKKQSAFQTICELMNSFHI